MSDRQLVVVYLDLAAAKARQLAEDERRGRHWEGDLERGIAEVSEALAKARHAARPG